MPKGIKHGSRDSSVVANNCMNNAWHNYFVLMMEHIDKVLDEDPNNVFVRVGSMGFASKGKLRTKIHWEYGGQNYKSASDFRGLLGGFDAHAWVEYIDKDSDVIVVDPWFEWYGTVCKLNNVKTKDKKNCRVYSHLQDHKEHEALLDAMVDLTIESGKMSKFVQRCFRELNERLNK